MSIQLANNIAFYATVISALAFCIAAVAQGLVERPWPFTLYMGLFFANTAIAVMATR